MALKTSSSIYTAIPVLPPQRPPDLNLPMLMLNYITEVAFPHNAVMLDYFATMESKTRLLTIKITSVKEYKTNTS